MSKALQANGAHAPRSCIYCLEEKGAEDFNREHVLHQSFGRFRNGLTLRECVCRSCNQYFGDGIDLVLARDSVETRKRVEFGFTQGEAKTLGRRGKTVHRFVDGPYAGARARVVRTPEGSKMFGEPQIGFSATPSGPFNYFMLDALPTKRDLQQLGLTGSIYVRSVEVDRDDLPELLRRIGLPLQEDLGDIVPDSTKLAEFETAGEIGSSHLRAIAKIAFNYLAHVAGIATARMSHFDGVRRYVRYGERENQRFVVPSNEPILARDVASKDRLVGHIITLSWRDEAPSVVSQVSLFNSIRYDVVLSRQPFAIALRINTGTFFDVANMSLIELRQAKRLVVKKHPSALQTVLFGPSLFLMR